MDIVSDEPGPHPRWFAEFLEDRAVRKLSPHTIKAYRQDFTSIASLIATDVSSLSPDRLTREAIRRAFARYAISHSAASVRRCWSTWNVLCTHLFTAEVIDANPMPFVGRPKLPRTLPKALPATAIPALVAGAVNSGGKPRATDWPERDLAIVLTGLLVGLRAGELESTDMGDVRVHGDQTGGVVQVRGKGGRQRHVPVEADYLDVLRAYLASRAERFPGEVGRAVEDPFDSWEARAPLFVGRDGLRITRGTIQSRVALAFKRGGPDAQPVAGALVHGLRHTFATELAGADVNVYTLMRLLGHESITTSQRYVAAAGVETRSAAAANPLYEFARPC